MNEKDLQILGNVVSRTWEDANYKAALLANPKDVLVEAGFTIRDEVSIEVKAGESGLPYSISDNVVGLPLPSEPADAAVIEQSSAELGNAELEQVVGGYKTMGGSPDLTSRHFQIGNWLSKQPQLGKSTQPCAW